MKDWVAKLGQRLARLPAWRARKREAVASGEEAIGSGAEETSGPGVALNPDVPAAAHVEDPAAPLIGAEQFSADDALAEADDPLSAPDAPISTTGVDDTAPAGQVPAGVAAAGLADLDVFPDAGGLEAPQRAYEAALPPAAPAADAPLAAARPTDPNAADPNATEAPADAESPAVSRVESFRRRLRGIAGLLRQKRVWIPGAGVAVVAVIGGLSFMLVQASSEKAGLEADLAAARQALRQADAAPSRIAPAVASPKLPATLADAPSPAAPPNVVTAQASATDAPPVSFHVARVPRGRGPVQMNCDLPDKASVSLNLMKCIEAFNEATAR